MHIGDLAPEIQIQILQLCSPSGLSALSRANASLRDMAEYVLYNRIHFCVWPFDSTEDDMWKFWALTEKGSLLHTLTTNPWKASMVEALYVEFGPSAVRPYMISSVILRSILVRLAESLEKTPNLVDLRILWGMTTDPSEGRISQAIRGGHFQLHTLCLEYYHDLKGIIDTQPGLRLLGIYQCHSLDTRYRFQNLPQSRTALKVIMLDCSDTSAISTFPSLPQVEAPEAAGIPIPLGHTSMTSLVDGSVGNYDDVDDDYLEYDSYVEDEDISD